MKVLFEQFDGGLAELYRRSFSTLVSRIKREVDARLLATKDEKIEALDVLMSTTIFAMVDDDLKFINTTTYPETLQKLKADNTILLGEVEVTEVRSSYPRWDNVSTGIMNLFLRFKHEIGTAVLTPRAAIVGDLFHQPGVEIGRPYADQIWFAGISAQREKMFTKVQTTIVEESYPSNAAMTARLVRFLEKGEDINALEIFENLKASYSTPNDDYIYTIDDLNTLISTLAQRNLTRIETLVDSLIAKKLQ